jgi:hypothetical protein
VKYAVLVGVAPIVLAFIAGFFGATVGIGWPAYIAWFVLSLAVGAGVVAFKKRTGSG